MNDHAGIISKSLIIQVGINAARAVQPTVVRRIGVEAVLVSKLRFPRRLLHDTMVFMRDSCEVIPAAEALPLPGLDRADGAVVAGALTAKVDAIVTGDQAILALGEADGIPILSPRGLWDMLRKR